MADDPAHEARNPQLRSPTGAANVPLAVAIVRAAPPSRKRSRATSDPGVTQAGPLIRLTRYQSRQ